MCLRELAAAEDRQTYYGLFGRHLDVRFGEFDRDGNLLREVVRPTSGVTYYGRIVVHTSGRYATFVEQSFDTNEDAVVTVDLETFTVSEVRPSDAKSLPADVAAFGDARVVAVDRSKDGILLIDVDRRAVLDAFPICGGAKKPEAVFVEEELAYALSTEDQTMLSVVDLEMASSSCRFASPFAGPLDARFPLGFVDGALVVVGRRFDERIDFDTGRALLTLYLPDRDAFLPGALDIGFGLVTRAVLVDDVVYAILPWSAEVVRVTLEVPR